MGKLLDFPAELLLQVIESGVGIADAVALTTTCRSLYPLLKTKPFWIILARNAQRHHPLPLPSFRTLESLEIEEISAACRHHSRLLRNLSRLPNPTLKSQKVLHMDPSDVEVYHFAFLPGGRYLIALMQNGVFECWDTWSSDAEREAIGGDAVGKKLASFQTHRKPASWNFEMGEREVTVVIVCVVPRKSMCLLDTLRLQWNADDDVSLEHLCRTTSPFLTERIHIQDNIICATGTRTDSASRVMILLDPLTQRQVCIDSGIIEKDEIPRYDSFPASKTGVMLYREDEKFAQTHTYEDVRRLLDDLGSSDETMPIVFREPDTIQRYVFEDDCVIGQHEDWFVTHPWNTPNFGRDSAISVMSSSRAMGQRPGADRVETMAFRDGDGPSYRTLTHHWFAPPNFSTSSPSSPSSAQPQSLRRWVHNVPDLIQVGIEGSEIICPGSHGTHLMWIWGNIILEGNDDDEGGDDVNVTMERRVHLATLPQLNHPSDLNYPPEIAVRDLLIDPRMLDLARVASTDIEDSHGIIGLAMYRNNELRTLIHLLHY